MVHTKETPHLIYSQRVFFMLEKSVKKVSSNFVLSFTNGVLLWTTEQKDKKKSMLGFSSWCGTVHFGTPIPFTIKFYTEYTEYEYFFIKTQPDLGNCQKCSNIFATMLQFLNCPYWILIRPFYSRVHIRSDKAFYKILNKPSIKQKKKLPHMNAIDKKWKKKFFEKTNNQKPKT